MFDPVQLQTRVQAPQNGRSRFKRDFFLPAVGVEELFAELVGVRFEVIVERRERFTRSIQVDKTGPISRAIDGPDLKTRIPQNLADGFQDPIFQ